MTSLVPMGWLVTWPTLMRCYQLRGKLENSLEIHHENCGGRLYVHAAKARGCRLVIPVTRGTGTSVASIVSSLTIVYPHAALSH